MCGPARSVCGANHVVVDVPLAAQPHARSWHGPANLASIVTQARKPCKSTHGLARRLQPADRKRLAAQALHKLER
jgi:hypothetical protein